MQEQEELPSTRYHYSQQRWYILPSICCWFHPSLQHWGPAREKCANIDGILTFFMQEEMYTFKTSFILLESFVKLHHAAKINLRRPRLTNSRSLSMEPECLKRKKIHKWIYIDRKKMLYTSELNKEGNMMTKSALHNCKNKVSLYKWSLWWRCGGQNESQEWEHAAAGNKWWISGNFSWWHCMFSLAP